MFDDDNIHDMRDNEYGQHIMSQATRNDRLFVAILVGIVYFLRKLFTKSK